MDSMHQAVDFRPRSRVLAMGGIPWLPRITDKARAKLRDGIGDYIYPCPADRNFLERLGISDDAFSAIVASCETDEEVIGKVRPYLEKGVKSSGGGKAEKGKPKRAKKGKKKN